VAKPLIDEIVVDINISKFRVINERLMKKIYA